MIYFRETSPIRGWEENPVGHDGKSPYHNEVYRPDTSVFRTEEKRDPNSGQSSLQLPFRFFPEKDTVFEVSS